eukprot:6207971-Pleurochrysis_carterae.AAC.3
MTYLCKLHCFATSSGSRQEIPYILILTYLIHRCRGAPLERPLKSWTTRLVMIENDQLASGATRMGSLFQRLQLAMDSALLARPDELRGVAT